MIITCNNCAKKFDVDSSVIPEKGRLLQCNSCDHKWFFKKKVVSKPAEELVHIKKNSDLLEIERSETIELLDDPIEDDFTIKKISIKKNKDKDRDIDLKIKSSKKDKNYNILGLTIVFIISFIALIIVLDTFQDTIGKIFPNIEFLLYSLYETINDIVSFLRDLI